MLSNLAKSYNGPETPIFSNLTSNSLKSLSLLAVYHSSKLEFINVNKYTNKALAG